MPDEMNDAEEAKSHEERAAARAALEQKSTAELFSSIKEMDDEDDAAWNAVTVLRKRGTAEVFQIAKQLSMSDSPRHRASGLRVLAQLGAVAGRPESERPFMTECVSIAVSHLEDSDQEVVRCAAWALSHLATIEARTALLAMGGHPDSHVRLAVAHCIGMSEDPESLPIIIKLMEDEDEEVRDWATFNVSLEFCLDGDWKVPDSPEVRAALHKRLDDKYEDARREAIWGLAKRRDPVGLRLLLELLESEDCWSGDTMAAEETLGVPYGTDAEELCRGLRELQKI